MEFSFQANVEVCFFPNRSALFLSRRRILFESFEVKIDQQEYKTQDVFQKENLFISFGSCLSKAVRQLVLYIHLALFVFNFSSYFRRIFNKNV